MGRKHKSPSTVRAEAKARSQANLKRGSRDIPPESRPRPPITADRALLFTKLCAAGLSPTDALAYLAPDYHASLSQKSLGQWVASWCNSPLVVAAVDEWNHGPWHTLSPDQRITLALDHHIAQLAYLLYTSDYLADSDLGKIRDARQVLLDWVKTSGKVEDAMTRAIRDILEGKAAPSGPPQLAPAVGVVSPPASTRTGGPKAQAVPPPSAKPH